MKAKATPIQRALAKFDGSATRLAAAVGGGVLRQHVEHWAKSGRVPEKHVRSLSDVSGVPCWDFCPDDWWRIWPDLIGRPGAPAIPSPPEPATPQAN